MKKNKKYLKILLTIRKECDIMIMSRGKAPLKK